MLIKVCDDIPRAVIWPLVVVPGHNQGWGQNYPLHILIGTRVAISDKLLVTLHYSCILKYSLLTMSSYIYFGRSGSVVYKL